MVSASLTSLAVTLAVTLGYLVIVRLVDVNEREPAWSLALVFSLGGAAATVLSVTVSPVVLTLDVWSSAALRESALWLSLGAAFWIFAEIAQLRGWSEVTDVVDGLVYGVAGGLGFSGGDAIASLAPASSLTLVAEDAWSVAWRTALAGLAQGVYGAVLGAGFGLAVTRSTRARWLWPIAGLVVAVALQGAHDGLAYGNALGGESAMWRSHVALGLPLLALSALGACGLSAERRAIAAELSHGRRDGDVTSDELSLLAHVWRRQRRYVGLLVTGQVARLRATAGLHNRQVMLAVALRRLSRATHDVDRQRATHEVDALRRAIRSMRAHGGAAAESTR